MKQFCRELWMVFWEGGFFWRFGRSQVQKTEEKWPGDQNFLLFCGRHKWMTPNTLTWSNFQEAIYIENAGIFADCLCGSINTMYKSSSFPNPLKLTDVTPLHKKGGRLKKKNYRPVSIFQFLSIFSERIIFAQLSAIFDYIFSKYQCRFGKAIKISIWKC